MRAEDYPDDRPIYEARPDPGEAWVWHVWDIEHPEDCNHFPMIQVDSKGACDDSHEGYARICADALNAKFAAGVNQQRREEIEHAKAMEARQGRDPKGLHAKHDSAVAKPFAQTSQPIDPKGPPNAT